jgi:hypothetical protein
MLAVLGVRIPLVRRKNHPNPLLLIKETVTMQKYVAKVKVKFKVYGAGLIFLLLGGTGVHFAQPCDL